MSVWIGQLTGRYRPRFQQSLNRYFGFARSCASAYGGKKKRRYFPVYGRGVDGSAARGGAHASATFVGRRQSLDTLQNAVDIDTVAAETPRGQGEKILVVEDDPTVRLILSDALQ